MLAPVTLVNDAPRRFGRAVEQELDRRHRAAVAAATGRVLDLWDPAGRAVLAAVIDGRSEGVEQFDTVVSVDELVRFPDLAAAMAAIDELLAPGGRLIAVEPVARPGTASLFVAAPFSALPRLRGFHIGRDLLVSLRTTALVGDDIERFTIATSMVPLRHHVAVVARRAVPTGTISSHRSPSEVQQ